MRESFLNSDGDCAVVDDLLSMAQKFFQKPRRETAFCSIQSRPLHARRGAGASPARPSES